MWYRLSTKQAPIMAAWLIAVAALVAPGCGGREKIARVAGRVTLDGQPLGGAQIVFENVALGVSVNVPLAADGTYTARTYDAAGLPPGTYHIAVRPGEFGSGEAPLISEAATRSEPASSNIPERYRSTATSGLTASVVAGENPSQDFVLTLP